MVLKGEGNVVIENVIKRVVYEGVSRVKGSQQRMLKHSEKAIIGSWNRDMGLRSEELMLYCASTGSADFV
jgi:hypothetical protein